MTFLIQTVFFIASLSAFTASAQTTSNGSIKGTYQAVLSHEQTGYYQHATITLSTLNTGDGNLKISAGVRMMFGDPSSNEFLTYDYPDCAFNILTRQISLKDNNSGVSFVGVLKDGGLKGDWYSPRVGRVGTFVALKSGQAPIPRGAQLVKSVTGYYVGKITNTNPASNLPENVTISLVTTQDPSAVGSSILVSGNMRLYFGDLDSNEYVETKFTNTDFNFYNRFLTAKTANYGITLKGPIGLNGVFKGDVFADGVGQAGTIEVISK